MPIVNCSDTWLRDEVMAILNEQKEAYSSYSVLDVGGASNPWADQWTDAYVDINPLLTEKHVYKGDICLPEVWEQVREKTWDFTICTHTLEDIRNPEFVLSQLLEVSKSGFIAVPNKHQELSCVQSRFWLGYGHHRWVFTIRDKQKLYILAKLPVVNYFLPSNRLAHVVGRIPRFSRLKNRLFGPVAGPNLDWVDSTKTKPPNELGFLWVDDFEFEFIHGDYSGHGIAKCASLYREQLREGI